MHFVTILFFLLVFCCSYAAENSQYMHCFIPDTVITDEVFEAKIVFRNNGTTIWGFGQETPVTLVSQAPKCNMTWGTYFIILGQGREINPGDTCMFSSRLKAPSIPGTYSFGWQIQRWEGTYGWDTTTQFFGDTVKNVFIHVMPRTETPLPPYAHKDSLLDTSDFEYAGSFKLPGLSGYESRYSSTGIALKTSGQEKHLIVRTDTYDSYIYETTIPALVHIVDGNVSGLNTGALVQDWGHLAYGTINGEDIWANGGFWFDDSSQVLYWTHYNEYYTGGPSQFPFVMATRLNGNGTTANMHYWHVPGNIARFKSYWGGLTVFSKRFADMYTGGRKIAAGFGGIYSICATASRGPGLGAIGLPDNSDTLDLLELISYSDANPAPRDGDYLPVVGFWDKPFPKPWKGWWTYGDGCHAGVFIDLPDKKGYVTFSSQIVGRIGYDYGGYNTDPHDHQVWYFYDIKDIGLVAQGVWSVDSIFPASYSTVHYPVDHEGVNIAGACFDSASRMLYLYAQYGQPDGRPVIHAYHVKEGDAAVENIAALGGEGPTISAFPNPFNPATVIKIALPAGAPFSMVKIFDIHGKLIQTLSATERMMRDGFVWDASGFASGVYIARVTAGGRTIHAYLTLVK